MLWHHIKHRWTISQG